ncbi:MAG: hypothetical protein AUK24_09050 [Syntrophaceae bacterium CG2_30_49_12]|nr:MAG: hypothetical protein AUK24_09050 [Syntrophaceae bacterium CG2_30_49_12]PIU23434.1 MAG: hypothetical protein COT13_03000 [Chloroflexi bacterium CG08_land_8_20_14_0_20_45_12]PIX27149.1 MAG: hypothetical protein COZ67_03910 [Chloroflexi bacterium CG_4_8_14_3_um_filter_45_15]PJB49734.1 MAG: hypothetical protein CO103_04280 [Chloroflexi bacterium CG_4_9_14_3_um_filter_45_9]
MQSQKGLDNYQRALGQIIGNLHSLELILRLFLHNVDSKRYGFPPPEVNLDKIRVGDVVPESYFVNYDSLKDLVKKYNSLVTSQNAPDLCVDETIVNLRDAFAHGRVLSPAPTPPFQLYKFGRPTKSRQVLVEYVTSLTERELAGYIRRLFQQIKKVEEACKQFCPSALG